VTPVNTTAYSYDALGGRIAAQVTGTDAGTTSFLRDRGREYLEIDGTSPTAVPKYVHVYGLNGPIARFEIATNGDAIMVHRDRQGSVFETVDTGNHNTAADLAAYGAFGETATATGYQYKYSGYRIDAASAANNAQLGLYYLNARYYLPLTGRFLETDPIGTNGGVNLYAYVGNDPLNLIDPLGLSSDLAANSANFVNPLTGLSPAQELGATAQTLGILGGLGEASMCCLHMPGEAAGLSALGRAAAALEAMRATQALVEAAPSLPPFVAGGKTLGILRTPTGDIPLQSGWQGPASSVPSGTSGFDIVTRTHVEGHAAALMQQQGITDATLYINNPEICSSCTKLLPRMLPEGSKLTVVRGPGGGPPMPFEGVR